MIRTKFAAEKNDDEPMSVEYNQLEEPIIISIPLFELLKGQRNFGDLYVLYSFYYYTAKWQKTNQPKAVTAFTAKGLGWGIDKVVARKKELKKLGLIRDIRKVDKSGKILGYYIHVNFIWTKETIAALQEQARKDEKKPARVFSHGWENTPPNALSPSSINALSLTNDSSTVAKNDSILIPEERKVTPAMFHKFWKLYPRKVDQGKADIAWNKLCKKNDRPTWRQIELAIFYQRKTPRWQDQQFIPHPTTWINNKRWLDNPEEMKTFTKNIGRINRVGSYSELEYRDDGEI